jgi:hypothetical protein
MSDNKNKKGKPDRSRINLTEDFEVRYWCGKFGISAAALREAVKVCGSNEVKVVEKYLK